MLVPMFKVWTALLDILAAGFTHVCILDLYIIDEIDDTSYRHNGTKKNYDLITSNIAVKDGNKVRQYSRWLLHSQSTNLQVINVTYTFKKTVYGPVVSEFYDSRLPGPLALRWTITHEHDTTYAVYIYNVTIASLLLIFVVFF